MSPGKVELDQHFDIKEPMPVTVVTSTKRTISASWLNETHCWLHCERRCLYRGLLSRYLPPTLIIKYTLSLMKLVQLSTSRALKAIALADDAEEFIRTVETKHVFTTPCSAPFPNGPYFATCSGLHYSRRLYEDFTNSSVLALYPISQRHKSVRATRSQQREPPGSTLSSSPIQTLQHTNRRAGSCRVPRCSQGSVRH
ncbi:hypothetical protein BDV12DRAFT_9379 [Aspergillus spectabilis]